MAHGTYRLTEIVGTSDDSVDEAIANGVAKASETLRNMDWFDVVSIRGALNEGRVAEMQVTLKVGFRVDD